MRSDAHNHMQDIIRNRYMEMSWIAIKEHCVKGKKIDVLAQNRATRYTIANEVQLTTKHYKENILKDFWVGCDEVRIISISKKVSDRIEKKAHEELSEALLSKVKFLTIEDFIPP